MAYEIRGRATTVDMAGEKKGEKNGQGMATNRAVTAAQDPTGRRTSLKTMGVDTEAMTVVVVVAEMPDDTIADRRTMTTGGITTQGVNIETVIDTAVPIAVVVTDKMIDEMTGEMAGHVMGTETEAAEALIGIEMAAAAADMTLVD